MVLKMWTLSDSLLNRNLVFRVTNSSWLSPEQDCVLDNIFFSNRVVNGWKKLPEVYEMSDSLELQKESKPSPQI